MCTRFALAEVCVLWLFLFHFFLCKFVPLLAFIFTQMTEIAMCVQWISQSSIYLCLEFGTASTPYPSIEVCCSVLLEITRHESTTFALPYSTEQLN